MNVAKDEINEILGLESMKPKELRTEIKRKPWDHTFLIEAALWAERSHDAETQCGCVLVKDKTPLSVGYNGFIRDIDDSVLPNLRPHKYPFMIHAEINAILNCARQGKSTLGAIAYITTKPCVQCFQFLWQAGITRIVYSNISCSHNYNHDEADDQIQALLLLINPITNVPVGAMRMNVQAQNLVVDFIDKNDVLPKKKDDK